MAPQKLTEADKQEILTLYRTSDETTTSLASRFSVSTSTISRILKQSLSEQEYDRLIQGKRLAGSKGASQASEPTEPPEPPEPLEPLEEQLSVLPAEKSFPAPKKRILPESSPAPEVPLLNGSQSPMVPPVPRSRRRRLSASSNPESSVLNELEELEKEIQQELRHAVYENLDEPPSGHGSSFESNGQTAIAPDLDEALEDEEEEDLDDLDEDLDDLDDDLQDDEDDDDDLSGEEGEADYSAIHLQSDQRVQILPLALATLPRTCYLVVDRASELITRPLSDFADLGQIPELEAQSRTLPVFDNHRVAKRFMRRMQRIVKIPDSQMFFKASPYLQAKGITRLLVDGHIYALDGVDEG